jgi:hypothetical protein
MKHALKPAFAAALLCAAGAANATSMSFFDGATEVAVLTWSGSTDFSLEFLTAPDAGAFIKNVKFQGPAGTFADTDSTTASSATFCPTGCTDAGTDYNWAIEFGTANDDGRLVIGETATWSITVTDPDAFDIPGLVHINAYLNDESIKLSGCLTGSQGCGPIPAIPEPQTYALMLAGLGIVGFLAKRRRA